MKLNAYQKTFQRQHGQSDCGVACLNSIISYHGGHATLDDTRQLSGTTTRGTSLLGLQQAADELGFRSKGLKASDISNLKELKEPAILHVVLNGMQQHYVVFYGFADNELIIGDPAKGVELWSVDQLEAVWRDKVLLSLAVGETFKKTHHSRNRYTTILQWVKEDFNILLTALFLGALISVFNLSTAVFTQKLIDEVLPAKKVSLLIVSLSLFGILLIFKSILGYIRSGFLLNQSRDFNVRMVGFFFKSLINLPKTFFDSKKSGEMIARMNDTRRIQSTVSNLVGNLILETLVLTLSVVAIFIYQWQVGLLVTALIPFFATLYFRFKKPILNHQKEAMTAYGLNESNYIDVISGMPEIKNSSKQSLFEKITMTFYGNYQQKSFALGKVQVKFGFVAELLTVLLSLTLFGYTAFLYLQDQMALGTLIACLSLSGTITPSIIQISLFNIQIQEAKVAFDRMDEFSGLALEDLETGDPSSLAAETLTLKNISFHYPGTLDLLHNIDLEIKKGEFRTLLGESGEGKSTLIQIIQRFYQPQSGQILLDKTLITELNLNSYRDRIAVVPQEIKIFNNSLLFNIVLSEDEKEYSRFLQWSQEHGFNLFFEKFPQGYATLLGEEGTNISGGQRQLVGLARALFRNPQFLILDESTSAMDKNTENFILKILKQFQEHTAILLITHRVTTASKSDHIYILENGKIIDQGSPACLIKGTNMYSDFYHELDTSFLVV